MPTWPGRTEDLLLDFVVSSVCYKCTCNEYGCRSIPIRPRVTTDSSQTIGLRTFTTSLTFHPSLNVSTDEPTFPNSIIFMLLSLLTLPTAFNVIRVIFF